MNNKKQIIFYSWQSDDKAVKNYIEKCLNNAVKNLNASPILQLRPTLDDSTKGEMGAVEIPTTIMKKIDECAVFVADLSIVGECRKRKIVNQNVMYELGYMIGKHTASKVIMLFSTDSGEISELPFDISHRRVLGFSIQNDKTGERLTSQLTNLLEVYFGNAELLTRLPSASKIELDNEEIRILQLFSSMGSDKRVMVAKTMGGSFIIPASKEVDKKLLKQLNENPDPQKLVANLDGLVDKNILKVYQSINGTPNYVLKKLGYKIVEDMTN